MGQGVSSPSQNLSQDGDGPNTISLDESPEQMPWGQNLPFKTNNQVVTYRPAAQLKIFLTRMLPKPLMPSSARLDGRWYDASHADHLCCWV